MKRGTSHPIHTLGPLVLVFLALALAGNYNGVTGAVVYRDSGFGGYGGYGGSSFLGGYTFSDFYYQYAPFIDALLFLIIFLSLGQTVFSSHFKKSGQSLYIGVGLMLSFALLLWEEQNNFYILEEFGMFALILLGLLILVVAFRAISAHSIPHMVIPLCVILFSVLYVVFAKTPLVSKLAEELNLNLFENWLVLAFVISAIWILFGLLLKTGKGRRAVKFVTE